MEAEAELLDPLFLLSNPVIFLLVTMVFCGGVTEIGVLKKRRRGEGMPSFITGSRSDMSPWKLLDNDCPVTEIIRIISTKSSTTRTLFPFNDQYFNVPNMISLLSGWSLGFVC